MLNESQFAKALSGKTINEDLDDEKVSDLVNIANSPESSDSGVWINLSNIGDDPMSLKVQEMTPAIKKLLSKVEKMSDGLHIGKGYEISGSPVSGNQVEASSEQEAIGYLHAWTEE